MTQRHRVLDHLRASTASMLDALAALVSVESPSAQPAATAACAEHVAALGQRLLGHAPDILTVDGHAHVRWRWGATRVVLLGHLDTVWPLGTIARWPFTCSGDTATGPGAFDMKAGIVQGLFALSALDDLDGVTMLLTSDEEVGSATSRALVEQTAAGADAVLVLEPSAGGALKTARKGISTYRVTVTGRASHAGLDPERGVNAVGELAAQIAAVEALGDPDEGTTVTPTVITGGSAVNVVPAEASCDVDVRAASAAEQQRVDAAIRALKPVREGAAVTIRGGPNRPPLESRMSAELFGRAQRLAAELHLTPPAGAHVGGGSDGNLTAALGVPTLDGLGAVGDGAHAEGEHVVVSALAERAALVAVLVDDLLGEESQ